MTKTFSGRGFALILVMFVILFSAGCGQVTSSSRYAPTPPPVPKKWTIMMYLNGDEFSMQQDFIQAFHEILDAGAGSTENVNIVVQLDRYIYNPMPDFGGWTIAHRFYLTPGMEPTEQNAISDWGDGRGGREVDMADPAELCAFINWAAARYPAERNLLLIGDHGYGWQGLNIDMTSYGRFTALKGLRDAIESSATRFDLIALDACLMQMAEVAHELRSTGIGYLVGSENSGTTWPMAEILKAVTQSPAISTPDFGCRIVDLYHEAHQGQQTITLSLLDMGRIPSLSGAILALNAALLAGSDFPAIQDKAQAVMNAIEGAVVYVRNSPDRADDHGISIYFSPPDPEGYIPDMFFYSYIAEVTSFAEDTSWRDVLYAYYMKIYPGIPNSRIYHIRQAIEPFDNDKIDLYDFCERIVNWQD
ncbi:MAG: clostripain-related cysteine peptidase [bacterium]